MTEKKRKKGGMQQGEERDGASLAPLLFSWSVCLPSHHHRVKTYMDCGIPAHEGARATLPLPRMAMAALLPQLLQLFASFRPRRGGVTPDEIRGQTREKAVSEPPPVRKEDVAVLVK